MNHTNEEEREIWADQDSMPDILNQEPQGSCTAEDFEVLIAPSLAVHQENIICDFLDSGGEIHEQFFHHLDKTYFVATRQERITAYGETPLEAIFMWAHQAKN